MNPELRRNLWLQFSPLRLIISPLAVGIVLLLVWLVSDHSLELVARAAEWFYLLIVLFWGTRRAAELVAEEVAGGTWDSQRMSALGAWQMTWGKFIGGISYVWYSAGIAFLARLWAESANEVVPWQGSQAIDNLHLLGLGLLGQAVAFVASLVLLRKRGMRRRVGVTLSQFSGLAVSAVLTGHLDLGFMFRPLPTIDWFGWQFDGPIFALATLSLFLAWSLFGAYRLMRIELQFRSIPWAWAAFALFLMIYAEGLLYVVIRQAPNRFAAWVTMPFVLADLLTYAALFLEPKDVVRYRALMAALAGGRWARSFTLLPQWIPVFIIAGGLGVALSLFGGLDRLAGLPHFAGPGLSLLDFAARVSFATLPVSLVLYLLRDALVVLFFNFGNHRGYADLTALICLALVYLPASGVLASLHATSLIPILAPYPAAPALISIVVPAIECAILGIFVLRRMRAAGRFKPATA